MNNLVVLSGAGVSAESGLKTFRDSNGLWADYKVEDVASIDGWHKNKELVLQFYNSRRAEIKNAEPNLAHTLIAQLEKHYNVTIATQNIDNLHERGGSTNIIHLHGEITKARSTKLSDTDYYNFPDKLINIGYNDIHLGDLAPDGGQLRPHIVWFGESVPYLSDAVKAVSKADILLIIGTSLNVYPAAGLVNYIKDSCSIYLIDPQEIHINYHNYHQIKDKASSGMSQFINILNL